MNKYLSNFNKLFSDNDQDVYQAVLEKKDWILNRYYIIGTYSNNTYIEDCFEGRLRFSKLMINSSLFDFNGQITEEKNKIFNERYRVCYLNNNLPELDDVNDFIIEINFNKLNDSQYRELFANFYPCLDEKEIKKAYRGNDLLLAMNKNIGDNVLIMDIFNLIDGCYNCRVIESIFIHRNADLEIKALFRKMCDNLNINYGEI